MKPKFPIFSSSRGLCGGKNVVLEDLTTDEPFIYRAERSGFCRCALLLCADGNRTRPMSGVKLRESFRQPIQ